MPTWDGLHERQDSTPRSRTTRVITPSTASEAQFYK